MKMIVVPLMVLFHLCMAQVGISQESSIQQIPSNYLTQVSEKAGKLEQRLDKHSDKALLEIQKLEKKIRKKAGKLDSLKAKELLLNARQQYANLEQKLAVKSSQLKQYIPSLDTLGTSLKFLQQNQEWISGLKNGKEKLDNALDRVKGLESQFQHAEQVKEFLKERRQYLKDQLQKFGFAKEIKKLNKQIYYYSQQVNEYKALLKDHKKAAQKAIELLSKTEVFQRFMKKNSMLASFFPMPSGTGGNLSAMQSGFAGLQTRAQLTSFIQQTALNVPGAMQQLQQNASNASSGLNELRNRIAQLTGNNNEVEMPDFKPNSQKTKPFLQRFEYGTTFQSQGAKGFFPATSDVGLSAGYKLNDKSIIGVAAAYKLGWGSGWRNIKLSNQGVGLRSFVDWKAPFGTSKKGILNDWWISGGYEMNYRTVFNQVEELKGLNAWQQSGLLGLTKSFAIKSKLFKKTKLQFLWDFLSYQQMPRTQPLIFRIGYNF